MRLADAGFLALCPEYFFRLGPLSAYSPEGDRPAGAVRVSKLDVAQWPVDLDRAADWLRAHSLGDGQLGTLGFCMGGSAALLMAARRTDAAASVSYYGFVRTPGRRAPSPIDHAHEMRGAILGHWGAADPAIPVQDVGDLDAALDRAGVEHEFHVYEGLGHNFLEPLLLAGDASGHEDACRSWTRTLTFFGERFDRRDPAPPLSR